MNKLLNRIVCVGICCVFNWMSICGVLFCVVRMNNMCDVMYNFEFRYDRMVVSMIVFIVVIVSGMLIMLSV